MVNSGPPTGFDGGQRRRAAPSSPSLLSHVELPDLLGVRAVFALGLDVDLPLPAEAVEVVDEVAAHEGLQRLVDVRSGRRPA